MNVQDFTNFCSSILEEYKKGIVVVPDRFVVPMQLENAAKRILYTKIIKRSGKYYLMQYENEKPYWCGTGIRDSNYFSFPRWEECGYDISNKIHCNRHWRKRGYPDMIEWKRE